MAASTDVIPKTLKGPKGHVLTWRKKVEFVRSTAYPRVMPPAGDELHPVLGMTDEQLAEALRPTVLRGGHEYIGECPGEFVTRLRAAEPYRRTASFSPWCEPRVSASKLGRYGRCLASSESTTASSAEITRSTLEQRHLPALRQRRLLGVWHHDWPVYRPYGRPRCPQRDELGSNCRSSPSSDYQDPTPSPSGSSAVTRCRFRPHHQQQRRRHPIRLRGH